MNGRRQKEMNVLTNEIEMNIAIDQTRHEKLAIFAVALKLLREGKFHATPMAEIAYLSRISNVLMEHVFDTRERLLEELSDAMLRQIETETEEACKKGETFRECVLNCWTALYNFYTRYPDTISFMEQFETLKSRLFIADRTHPGKLKSLVNLFNEQKDLSTETTPQALAWLLHENAMSAAKMNVQNAHTVPPHRLAEIFWNGISASVE